MFQPSGFYPNGSQYPYGRRLPRKHNYDSKQRNLHTSYLGTLDPCLEAHGT